MTMQFDNNTILAGITGSRAYGLNLDSSDHDILLVKTNDVSHYLGCIAQPEASREFFTTEGRKMDVTTYELKEFVRLLLTGNHQALTLLWAKHHLHATNIGLQLVECRSLFLTKAAINSLTSLALNAFIRFDSVLNIDAKNRYDKMWAVCIMRQCLEALKLGAFVVQRQDTAELMDLRISGVLKSRKLFDQIDAALETSTLPDGPDIKKINDLVVNMLQARLGQCDMTACPKCHQAADFEVCWCGDYRQNHTNDHTFVPMGCECGREKIYEQTY